MTAEQIVIEAENRLIIQAHHLSCVQQKLMKQLVRGWCFSEVVGAYMDLRNIADAIEALENDRRKRQDALGTKLNAKAAP